MNSEKYEKMDKLARLGHVNKLRALINDGADVNWVDEYWMTVLMSAVIKHRANSIRLLLSLGADPNMQDYHGETALFDIEGMCQIKDICPKKGRAECISILKTAMSKTSEGRNLQLISSANIRDLDSIKELVKAGADVNFQTNCGFTALTYVAISGYSDCMEYLIKAGADINLPVSDGRTPLMFTWGGEYQKCVDLLLTAGADIHIKDRCGFTAIMRNVVWADTVKKLVDRGGLVNEQSNDGWTALMEAAYDDYVDSVDILIKSGANINLCDKDGLTALMAAAEWNSYKSTKLLLLAGADKSIKNNDGETALDIAKKRNKKKCIKLLL